MRPLGGLGKVDLQSRSGKESPGFGTGGAGLGNKKDQRAHLQVGDKGTEAQRPGPQTGAEIPVWWHHQGRGRKHSGQLFPLICVCPQDQPRHRGGASVC